ASMSNILQFKKDYPQSKNVILINNYRSRQNILDLAYKFIKLNNPNRLEEQLKNNKNEEKLDKKLRSQIKGSGIIECINEKTLDDEVKKVISKIIELKNNNREATWNDFAILIRANDMANNFIPILERAEIPFIFLASKGLYSKPIIMDIIAYLKLLDDYHESAAVYRVLSIPVFNFSHKETSLFNYWARRRAWSLYETLKNAAALGFEKEAIEKINKILNLVENHTQLVKTKSVGEIILKFLNDSGYLKQIMRQDEQKMRDDTNYLNQFYRKIQNFERENDERLVKNFLSELQMEIESGEEGSLAPNYDSGPEEIKILTAHAAKGLEFQYIFIVNLVDRRFPTTERKEAILLPDDLIKEILPEGDIHLEEERRLFYVAMTRAKKGLFFSWAEDCGGVRKKKPSKFLSEIGMVSEKKLSEAASGLQILSSPLAKSETKEKTDINALPPRFSFSQLAAFSNCPYQYYLGFILKVPTQGKPSFSFGKTMHSTFQRIAELIIAKQSGAQKSLFNSNQRLKKFIEMISLKEMLDIFQASWIDDWYEDKNSKEKHFKKGKKIIKGFYDKFSDKIIQPLYLEKVFKIKIAGYVIRGAIDRVDKTEGGLKIIDYKTGEPKEKLTFENKKQLIIYQLACEQLFDEPIKKLSFYYLNNNSEVEFLGKDKELEKVEKWIADTIEKIKQNNFSAKPGNLCKWCDFKDICEKKK
ncbi:PD-(D/E)XK nuclease family protein, partial [Candidatus Parcubacteria bacterium]|nr:PD-(D/E)XK nuclease family protein [Candidatus Parcubacteria bacterium]